MTCADSERALIDLIRENPIKFLKDQFKEGGVFGHTLVAYQEKFDVPLIMAIEYSDKLYVEVNVWTPNGNSYSLTTYEACTTRLDSGEVSLEFDTMTLYATDEYDAPRDVVKQIAAGDAVQQWANMMQYYTYNQYTEEEYAWFFPMGVEKTEYLNGLLLYATTMWNR